MNDWVWWAAGIVVCLWILICVAVGMRFIWDDWRNSREIRRLRDDLDAYDIEQIIREGKEK
jgi:hypothetical protein